MTTYNHMAPVKNSVGTILRGKGKAMVDPSIEALLEKYRPSTSPSRLDSVYMTEDRDFRRQGIHADEGYVHQVEPIGPIEKRDNKWIGELELRLKAPTTAVATKMQKYADLTEEELVRRYWAGVESSDPTWEIVAKEAKVVAVEDDIAPVRPKRDFY